MYGYIYMTTNLINNKKYIGQKVSDRFLNEGYLGSGKLLKRAIAKYGYNNFKVELLEECNSQDELNKAEIKWIAYYNAVNSNEFYNLQAGGREGNIKGSKLSAETCKKISIANSGSNNYWYGRGDLLSGDKNPNYGNHALKGRKFTEEHKRKISESRRNKGGYSLLEETKSRISKSLSGNNNPNFGKFWYTDGSEDILMTEEDFHNHYENLGFHRGKKHLSGETRNKISKARMNHEVSLETRNKISKTRILSRSSRGENNPMYGKGKRSWINNGKTNKLVLNSEIDEYLSDGFVKGMIKYNNKGVTKQ